LWNNGVGTVVCSIDDAEYTAEYSEADWGYLEKGILVLTETAGVIHYMEPEAEFLLVSRKQ
jgi:hypothetical protein